MASKALFKCVIMSAKTLIYENEVQSVFLNGDRGEFEILAYHYPLLSVLNRGDVVVDGKESIPISGGIVRFWANECMILVEESS